MKEKQPESRAALELMEQAWTARREGRGNEAHEKLLQAASLCRQAGARRELALVLGKLGHVEEDLGNPDVALALYEERVTIHREEDQPLALAHAVRHVGDIHRNSGRQPEAEACYKEALSLYRNHGQPPTLDLANAIRPMAIVKENTGMLEEAKHLWEEARDLYNVVGVKAGVVECSRRIERLES